jgi:hypothetical protein
MIGPVAEHTIVGSPVAHWDCKPASENDPETNIDKENTYKNLKNRNMNMKNHINNNAQAEQNYQNTNK